MIKFILVTSPLVLVECIPLTFLGIIKVLCINIGVLAVKEENEAVDFDTENGPIYTQNQRVYNIYVINIIGNIPNPFLSIIPSNKLTDKISFLLNFKFQ